MRIHLSSNLVTALYILLFEITVQLLLQRFIQVFLSSWNLKLIYQNREPVQLTNTRLSLLSHQGLTKRAVGRLTAILSTIVLTLSLVGSFSLNGVSREATKTIIAPVVTDYWSPDELLDFTKHASEDGKTVSATFLAIRDATGCTSGTGAGRKQYSAVNDMEGLDILRWAPGSTINNSTCRMRDDGFVDKVSIQTSYISSESVSRCGFSFNISSTAKLAPATDVLVGPDCSMPMVETWCARYAKVVCVGLLEGKDGFTTLTMQVADDGTLVMFIDPEITNERMYSTSLRSMAYLIATESVSHYRSAKDMSLLSVRQNVEVEVYDGQVSETDIDIALFCWTLGPALIILAFLGAVSLIGWVRYVLRAGRCDYKRFYSAADMLGCAICEATGKGGCRFRTEKTYAVGLCQRRDNTEVMFFPEEQDETLTLPKSNV